MFLTFAAVLGNLSVSFGSLGPRKREGHYVWVKLDDVVH